MAYIIFQNIVKRYGNNEVLKNIDLEIEKGQLVTLLGPSGCGKSTLLRCLAGLETVTSGKIYLDGNDITEVEPKKRDIGMVFQQYSLFPNLTVEQNVAFGLKIKKCPRAEIQEKTRKMLEMVGLSAQRRQYPAQLSGGQQQRAALARALIVEPKVLLLDEPLSAIDALLRRSLQIEIRRIQKEMGITAVFVTHDQDEAMVMSDQIHLLNQGKIEQSAAPAELYVKPATRFAASFIGNYNLLSAEKFQAISGAKIETEYIAFRPEIISLRTGEPEGCLQENECAEEIYMLRGTIAASLPHGNILRYAVLCNGGIVNADVLFTNSFMYREGEPCCMVIRKSDCVLL